MYIPPNPEQIRADINEILKADLPWGRLAGKHILITGASGMLPAYVVETLLLLPEFLGCEPPVVIGLVRNLEKAEQRFANYLSSANFELRTEDICLPLTESDHTDLNVIIHAASISRPDAARPVDVMAPNITGTWNLLELSRTLPNFEQFLYFSSGIVNGENIKSDIPITEEMFFPTSCTSPTACYTESKRAGETICLSFMHQFQIPVKLLRYFGSYGPGMDLYNDPRAFTSFVKNAVIGENITLRSAGAETRFWCYITDAIEAFFRIYFNGEAGEAWNIANPEAGSTIRELAGAVCDLSPHEGVSVQFDAQNIPSGYTPFKSEKITMPDISKLRSLGFVPKISVREGLRRTINAYTKKPDESNVAAA